jgi:hypothetical protein
VTALWRSWEKNVSFAQVIHLLYSGFDLPFTLTRQGFMRIPSGFLLAKMLFRNIAPRESGMINVIE